MSRSVKRRNTTKRKSTKRKSTKRKSTKRKSKKRKTRKKYKNKFIGGYPLEFVKGNTQMYDPEGHVNVVKNVPPKVEVAAKLQNIYPILEDIIIKTTKLEIRNYNMLLKYLNNCWRNEKYPRIGSDYITEYAEDMIMKLTEFIDELEDKRSLIINNYLQSGYRVEKWQREDLIKLRGWLVTALWKQKGDEGPTNYGQWVAAKEEEKQAATKIQSLARMRKAWMDAFKMSMEPLEPEPVAVEPEPVAVESEPVVVESKTSLLKHKPLITRELEEESEPAAAAAAAAESEPVEVEQTTPPRNDKELIEQINGIKKTWEGIKLSELSNIVSVKKEGDEKFKSTKSYRFKSVKKSEEYPWMYNEDKLAEKNTIIDQLIAKLTQLKGLTSSGKLIDQIEELLKELEAAKNLFVNMSKDKVGRDYAMEELADYGDDGIDEM